MRDCGYCHTCGTKLRIVLDGEEWCPKCGVYRRYGSHGWSSARGDNATPCPEPEVDTTHLRRCEPAPDAHLEAAYEDRYCEAE